MFTFPGIGSTIGPPPGVHDFLKSANDTFSGIYDSVSSGLSDFNSQVQSNGLFPTLWSNFSSGADKTIDYLFGPDSPDLADLADIDLSDILPNDTSANPSGFPVLRQDTFDYINAELSKAYGMDRNTAYQEALSNSAYQRAVADMKKAGLNPSALFGSGRGSSADGVAYVGSGRSSTGSGSGSAKSGLFTQDQYHGLAAITGLITAIATKDPSKYYLGQSAAQGVMSALNVLDDAIK